MSANGDKEFAVSRKRPAGQAAGGEAKRARSGLTLEEALVRIRKLLGRPAKFPQASAMLARVVRGKLDKSNVEQVAEALDAAAAAAGPHYDRKEAREMVVDLFRAAEEQAPHFRDAGAGQERMTAWSLRGPLVADLFGDDTFAFAGACRRVRQAVTDALPAAAGRAGGTASGGGPGGDVGGEGAPESVSGGGPAAAAAAATPLEAAVVDAIEFALRRWAMPWSRPPAKDVLGEATRRRDRFGAAARARLDGLATELARRVAAPARQRQALWTVDDERGVTHPLRRRQAP